MRFKAVAVAVLLGAVLFLAMTGVALAGPVERTTWVFDLTGTSFENPVTGSPILLSGTLEVREQWVSDKHYTHHVRGMLSAVDSATGQEYRVSFNDSQTWNYANGEGKEVNIVRFIAPGPGNNLFLKFHIHLVKGVVNIETLVEEVR